MEHYRSLGAQADHGIRDSRRRQIWWSRPRSAAIVLNHRGPKHQSLLSDGPTLASSWTWDCGWFHRHIFLILYFHATLSMRRDTVVYEYLNTCFLIGFKLWTAIWGISDWFIVFIYVVVSIVCKTFPVQLEHECVCVLRYELCMYYQSDIERRCFAQWLYMQNLNLNSCSNCGKSTSAKRRSFECAHSVQVISWL